MKKESRGRMRRRILIAAAAILIILCVLFGVGSNVGIPDIPGGFVLYISVLEDDGGVSRYTVTDAKQIHAVQHYIRSGKANRLREPSTEASDYPFLGFSDGAGQNARYAVYTGGVWIDAMGRAFSISLDRDAILALIPDVLPEPASLRDFPNRYLAASMTGAWDARLLEPAEAPPDTEQLEVRARERNGDQLSLTVFNPNNCPVTCSPALRLEVQLDRVWYTVPTRITGEAEEEVSELAPHATEFFTATMKDVEDRYGHLPAGHYRIVLLSYVSEFDVG